MANLYLIRELCERNKITIRELSQKIGCDESTIQTAIRKGSTTTARLEQIAGMLKVSVGYFFDGWREANEVNDLRNENKYLKNILEEKERTIEILLSERGKK